MKAKFYLLAALLGGLTIFVWGFIIHMGLHSVWEMTMSPLPNEQAIVDVLKSAHASNGMYYGLQGIFMTLFLEPGQTNMTSHMGPLLVIEFITDMLVALVLAWLLVRTNIVGNGKRALFAGGVGLAGWININLSYWNWYRHPFSYTVLEAVNDVMAVLLAGLVIAWLMNKQRPVTARTS